MCIQIYFHLASEYCQTMRHSDVGLSTRVAQPMKIRCCVFNKVVLVNHRRDILIYSRKWWYVLKTFVSLRVLSFRSQYHAFRFWYGRVSILIWTRLDIGMDASRYWYGKASLRVLHKTCVLGPALLTRPRIVNPAPHC